MGRPQKHDDATRTALLDAAESMLSSDGIDAISVRSVADAIGASTRAVYSVFGSKQALIEGLAARGYSLLADLVAAVPRTNDPLADLVAAGVDGFRRFAIGRPHLFRLAFDRLSPEVFANPVANRELGRSFGALTELVGRALATGRLGARTPLEVGYGFHSLCHGLAANELSQQPPPIGIGMWRRPMSVDAAAMWKMTLEAYVYGLGAMPDTASKPKRRR